MRIGPVGIPPAHRVGSSELAYRALVEITPSKQNPRSSSAVPIAIPVGGPGEVFSLPARTSSIRADEKPPPLTREGGER